MGATQPGWLIFWDIVKTLVWNLGDYLFTWGYMFQNFSKKSDCSPGVAKSCTSEQPHAFTNCVHGEDRARNVHITELGVQEYSCRVLISSCKNNLNLPLGCLLFCSLCCHVHSIAAMRWFFCFWASQFRSPAIKQTSLSQFKGWFLFILLCRQEKYHWTIFLLGLRINFTNMQQLYEKKCVQPSLSAESNFDQSEN